MTEKELQKLFQKKFAEREVPYNAEAWNKLSSMLDKAQMPWYSKPAVLAKASALAVAALTSIFVLVWNVNQSNKAETKNLPVDAGSSAAIPTDIKKSEAPSEDENPLSKGDSKNESGSHAVGNLELFTKPERSRQSSLPNDLNSSTKSVLASKKQSINASSKQGGVEDFNNKQLVFIDIRPIQDVFRYEKMFYNTEMIQQNEWSRNSPYPKVRNSWSQLGFGIQAFAGLTNRISNGKSPESGFSNYGFGAWVHYAINNQLGVESGLTWLKRGDMHLERKLEGVRYSFGAERETYVITAQSAQFLEVPVRITYRFKQNHQIKAGYYYSYMYNLGNNVLHSHMPEGSSSWQHTQWQENGFEDAFVSYDHGLSLAYSYRFNRGISIGIDYIFGLQDLSLDAHFNQNEKHYNRQFRLNLSYALF